MARGIVIGNVSAAEGSLSNAQASLSSIRGTDSNGNLVKYKVLMKEMEVGGWFKTKINSESRLVNSSGVFAIPFSWDPIGDNLARVIGGTSLDVKVTITTDNKGMSTFWGKAILVPDIMHMINVIKQGRMVLSGDNKAILKSLKPDLLKTLNGDELQEIPFTNFSTDQTAILGMLPDCVM